MLKGEDRQFLNKRFKDVTGKIVAYSVANCCSPIFCSLADISNTF